MDGTDSERKAVRELLLERFPVLADLPSARLDELIATAPLRSVPAGGVMFRSHTPCAGFPLVLEGSVKIVKATAGGREMVLYRVAPGEGCILSGGCLLSEHEYAATGVAECDVRVLIVPPALFHQLIVESEAFRRFVFDMYGARLSEVMELLEEVAFRRLDTRLAQLLIQRGPVVEATHQNLADELGSVRVFVSRLLKSFEDRGWVRLERERVTVTDLKALAGFARR